MELTFQLNEEDVLQAFLLNKRKPFLYALPAYLTLVLFSILTGFCFLLALLGAVVDLLLALLQLYVSILSMLILPRRLFEDPADYAFLKNKIELHDLERIIYPPRTQIPRGLDGCFPGS